MSKLIKVLTPYVAMLVLSTGCGNDLGGGQLDSHRGDYTRLAAKYNELLAKQRSLIDTSQPCVARGLFFRPRNTDT